MVGKTSALTGLRILNKWNRAHSAIKEIENGHVLIYITVLLRCHTKNKGVFAQHTKDSFAKLVQAILCTGKEGLEGTGKIKKA